MLVYRVGEDWYYVVGDREMSGRNIKKKRGRTLKMEGGYFNSYVL